ncbi:hypothetical protein BDQ12DRAFT_719089 [Crucibulum laeve]|uniref:CCHC-type domain-containing protein n=1 Tax=Crucibulum laeve TaxID=68775 RepID=A0A5C3MEY3_9AGAR|nr:hypothetical protein BDQ12DRAFT_719089 [Crucibulum laeve]
MLNLTPTRAMPARGDRGAPTFDANNPRELNCFFRDIEYLFEICAVTDDTAKKGHAIRYLDIDDWSLWQLLMEYTAIGNTGTWSLFKKAVYALYPGSEDASCYTVADMYEFVWKTRDSAPIKSMAELGSFYRRFLIITSHLVAQKLISELDQRCAFRNAFHPVLWDAIKGHLQIKFPDHPARAAYAVKDVYAAAIYILTDSNMQSQSLSTTSAVIPAGTHIPNISSALPIKQEEFISLITSIVESTLNQCDACQAASGQPSNNNIPSTNATANQAPRGPQNCNFCGDAGHFMRECLVLADYINTGKCKRNEQNLLVLSSGLFLPNSIAGPNFKARFDEYHRQNSAQAPVSNMMFGISASSPLSSSSSTSAQRAAYISSTANACRISDEEHIRSLEAKLYALRQRKQLFELAVHDATSNRRIPVAPVLSKEDPTVTTFIQETMQQPLPYTEEVPEADTHHTAAEEREARCQSQMSSAYIQTVQPTVIPPPGSLILHDPAENYHQSFPLGPKTRCLVVALESSALRSIVAIVDNQLKVECILNSGSQIIAMSAEICNALALAYDPTIILNVESVNGSVDASLGLIRNLPFCVGEMMIYLQVHVVRSPAYDILLGRPFDVLTASSIQNFSNGDQHITLQDPNSGMVVTVPTIPRGTMRYHQTENSEKLQSCVLSSRTKWNLFK